MHGDEIFRCTECGTRSPYVPYCATHARKIFGVEIRVSELENAGLGLFAVRDFKRGELVATYGGEKLTPDEVDKRYGVNGLAAYALTIHPNKLILDAITVRGYGSMANDGHGVRRCNAHFSKKGDTGLLRANRRIHNGEEILASYGREYWT